jgi:hypothetical protein
MSTRVLSFRPFRRVGDKLVVTSYMGWRKIYTSNYQGSTVKLLPFPVIEKGEVVYGMGNPDGLYKFWHPTKFEPLFWPTNGVIKHVGFGGKSNAVFENGVVHGYYPGEIENNEMKDNEVYSMFDCDGCPCFSHKTGIYVSENYPNKMHLFEPLTADVVYKYFEIMRDVLNNIQWNK